MQGRRTMNQQAFSTIGVAPAFGICRQAGILYLPQN